MREGHFTVSLVARSSAGRVAEAASGPRAILSYEFLANLAPALSVTDALACYDEVFTQTTVKPEIAQAMKPLWLHGYLSSDPHISNAAFSPLLHKDIAFKWALFDQWRTKFIEAGQFPETWSHFKERACDRRLGLREEMVSLLCSYLDIFIYNRHRAGQLRGLAGHYRYRADTDDGAVRPMLSHQYARLDVFDPSTLPPFFPGDCSALHSTDLLPFGNRER